MTAIQTLSERSLGMALDDPELERTLQSLDARAAWEPDDDQADWVSHAAGVDVQGSAEYNRVTTVFFFNEGIERHEAYAGPLPRGIELSWDRARVLADLGAPSISGPKHDCWDAEDHRVIVQYDDSGRITKVSLTRA